MRPITKFALAVLVAATIPVLAGADEDTTEGYVGETNGSAAVLSGTSECVRTDEWASATPDAHCNPAMKRPLAAVPVPGPVADAPARASEPVAAIPAPAPAVEVAAVPAPAPAVEDVAAPTVQPEPPVTVSVPVTAKPLPRRFSFSGDALFSFDKSTLRAEGMRMLDEMALRLEGAKYETILVTGHADRLGSKAYNQKLSERRANVVKDYLVGKNILIGRIDAEGRGERQPMTRDDTCLGKKSARVIACLQPDRRVDVETTGTTSVSTMQ